MPDPFHDDPASGVHWTVSNFAEVTPGVQTPLSGSIWKETIDWSSRRTLFDMGVINRRELTGSLPAPLESPLLRAFHGRMAFQVEFFALAGDRLPGITGEEAVTSIFGRRPPGIEYDPTKKRLPVIAWKFPRAMLLAPGQIQRAAAASRQWYEAELTRVQTLDRLEATSALMDAVQRLKWEVTLQAVVTMAVVQPLYQLVEDAARRTGVGDAGIFSGTGSPEVAGLVGDIWKASRGQLPIEDVVRRHGYHGPTEGELASPSWREDDTPLREMAVHYARKEKAPHAVESAREQERRRLVARVLAATPAWQRPALRLGLELAARRIPLRGAAKESFLRAFDLARAASRRIGAGLVEDGLLDVADDVFFLTRGELAVPPFAARELVAERRAEREACRAYTLPSWWSGEPPAVKIDDDDAADEERIEGVGVSVGVAEGIARVVLEPDFAEVEPGEILVAPFTDPGWASIMFVSSALVVDIGAALSHAAVVARELGIPCVVNTQNGTRAITTGDRIRVDGKTGVVEVLERAASAA